MKKFLSLVLALVMTMSLVTVSAGAEDFTDAADINYEEAVEVISAIGVVNGYANGSFGPEGGLTRQAAAKIICNMILGPTTAAELDADTAPYPDVAVDSDFAGYIAYCQKEGIISGYADGTFKPANPLTGYAFMKMLLGALGYDANVEGYAEPNWSINVAKQAIGIGLNAGLKDEFNGSDYVTREEAALYAFNTLKATMVEYPENSKIVVGGAEVTLASARQDVEWGTGLKADGKVEADGFVQFAEKYFSKLVRVDDTDAFMRPANTWTYNKEEIGTYVDYTKLVESYTTGTTGKTFYELLGSVALRDNEVECYVNGAGIYDITSELRRNNTDDVSVTGTGVLTEVYMDTDKEVITIVAIDTFLAQATADYNEKKEYAPLTAYITEDGVPYTVDVNDVAAVADVVEDGWYLVNISWKGYTPAEVTRYIGEVVEIMDCEILTDSTVTKFSKAPTKLTTGGVEYKANATTCYDADILEAYNENLLTDATYNVYMDQYGNFIGVDLYEGAANYVFITGYDLPQSNLSISKATAAAIFLDGTMDTISVDVKATNKNITKWLANEDNCDCFHYTWESDYTLGKDGETLGGYPAENCWYSYTKNEAGVYTLKPVRMTATSLVEGNETEAVIIDTANLDVDCACTCEERVYGEDATTFITVTEDVVDTTKGASWAITEVNGVYTGVQNVEIEVTESNWGSEIYTVYDSEHYVIGAIVFGEIIGNNENIAYVLDGALSEEKIGDTYYWEFEVIMDGTIQTLTAKSRYEDVIDAIESDEDGIVELRFDGEYVIGVRDVEKIYDDDDMVANNQVKGEDVYFVTEGDKLTLKGRTLYVTSGQDDVALAIASDANAVVIQVENDKIVESEYASVANALTQVADADEDVAGLQYEGAVIAVLNDKGAAEWVVFVNDTELVTNSGIASTTRVNVDVDGTVLTLTNVAGASADDKVAAIEKALNAEGYEKVSADVNDKGAIVSVTATKGAGNYTFKIVNGDLAQKV